MNKTAKTILIVVIALAVVAGTVFGFMYYKAKSAETAERREKLENVIERVREEYNIYDIEIDTCSNQGHVVLSSDSFDSLSDKDKVGIFVKFDKISTSYLYVSQFHVGNEYMGMKIISNGHTYEFENEFNTYYRLIKDNSQVYEEKSEVSENRVDNSGKYVTQVTTPSSTDDNSGEKCKSCGRTYTDSENKMSIAKTGMCKNCYNNFQWGQSATGN